MKNLVLLLIILACVSVGFGQVKKPIVKTPADELQKLELKEKSAPPAKPCDLTLKDAPVLRGLKLGMPKDEIVNLFSIREGYVITDTNLEGESQGVIATNLPAVLYRVPESFKGVKLLTFKIYLGKVSSLEIVYEPTEVKFDDNRQFAQNISDTFKLPAEGWSDYGIQRNLTCKEFKIEVGAALNQITVTDLTTDQQIKQREEEKRKLFKP